MCSLSATSLSDVNGVGHLAVVEPYVANQNRLWRSVTGQYYTPWSVFGHLTEELGSQLCEPKHGVIRVCDPFAGDGRLPMWIIENLSQKLGLVRWEVHLWDIQRHPLEAAKAKVAALSKRLNVSIDLLIGVGDSFSLASSRMHMFDLVVTNPPWENLKPDRRELAALSVRERGQYVSALRKTDSFLARRFPWSQPSRKFAGWGTNLARVGTELAATITGADGLLALITPASILSDGISQPLRSWLFDRFRLMDIAYFPAEAKAFPGADVRIATTLWRREPRAKLQPVVTIYDSQFGIVERGKPPFARSFHSARHNALPFAQGLRGAALANDLAHLPTFADLEGPGSSQLWAGRELDETGIKYHLVERPQGDFIKGYMIERFRVRQSPTHQVEKAGWKRPPSVAFERIAWRDISRPNQKRRVQAAVITAGWIAGNSLGVAHFRDGNKASLRFLLGIMSSCVFECQLRSSLATGHVSLSALRLVRIPPLDLSSPNARRFVAAVAARTAGDEKVEPEIEALAACLYGLGRNQLQDVLCCFPKLCDAERDEILKAYSRLHGATP